MVKFLGDLLGSLLLFLPQRIVRFKLLISQVQQFLCVLRRLVYIHPKHGFQKPGRNFSFLQAGNRGLIIVDGIDLNLDIFQGHLIIFDLEQISIIG